MKTVEFLIRHPMAVGLVWVTVIGIGGRFLGWSPGVIGLLSLAVIPFVSYLTVEEIARRR